MWSRRSFLTGATSLAVGSRSGRSQHAAHFGGGTSLVLAPATVTDRAGRFVRGISHDQFLLFDNGTRRSVNIEEDPQPLSLILAVHASSAAKKPLERLRKAVSLFGPLVIGLGGTAGVVAFRDSVETVVPLTPAFDAVTAAVRSLAAEGSGCSLMEAIQSSAEILRDGARNRRKVIVVVTEDRDRSGNFDLEETLLFLQKHNITVYPLTYSPGWMRPGPEAPDGSRREASPAASPGASVTTAFRAMAKQGKVSDALAAATGGRHESFFRQRTAERLIAEIGEELHTQYILSFSPEPSPGQDLFRPVRLSVAGRPDLNVRTRIGYWLTPAL